MFLTDFYRRYRTKTALQRRFSGKYAFVGVGSHSRNNLYPVLDYLNVELKYIVSRSAQTAALVNENRRGTRGVTDFDAVLADDEIRGVFVCASPTAHFALAKKTLAAGKDVFVEKPVCISSAELQQLVETEQKSAAFCQVGMQKRYSACTKILLKNLKKDKVISYSYRFAVGAYPEGNAFWDIFIHPVDLAVFLFGEAEILSVVKTQQDKGRTGVFLHLKHKYGAIGNLELSTQHSWSQPLEHMSVNTEKGIYEMKNHQTLTLTEKPNVILGVPIEKVFPHTPTVNELFNGNNFQPVFQYNQIVSQGYFGEIKAFVEKCEGRAGKNIASLVSLKNTYEIIEKIMN